MTVGNVELGIIIAAAGVIISLLTFSTKQSEKLIKQGANSNSVTATLKIIEQKVDTALEEIKELRQSVIDHSITIQIHDEKFDNLEETLEYVRDNIDDFMKEYRAQNF